MAKGLAALSGSKKGQEYLQSREKRALDIGLSLPLVIVSGPAILALGSLKALEDRGPMFYKQKRWPGQNGGKPLEVIKIRSMRPNADQVQNVFEFSRGRKPWQDARCTPFGSFIRRYHLDELPQLCQVLVGQLSLVGIRPTSFPVRGLLGEKWSGERLEKWASTYGKIPKGLSGLNQIFGNPNRQDEKRYHLDVFYAKNASLGLDFYLIFRTGLKILKNHGA